MYGYIYITTNKINGKQYIGKHKINGRESSYIGSGVVLKQAINKYGKENFDNEIIEYCETLEELNKREDYYIKKFDAVNSKNFYNVANGGQGGDLTAHMSEEEYAAHIEKFKGKNNSMYGVHRYGKDAPMYGKKHSPETRRKLSEAKKGKKLSEETKAKVKKSLKELYKTKTHHLAISILAIDENNEVVGKFKSMHEAAAAYNTYATKISRLCKNGKFDNDLKVSFRKS